MANNIFENELFLAFANASDNVYIYVCDMKDDLSRWSQNTVDYFGLPGEYIKSTGEVWMHWIHPDDRQVYLEDIQAVFSESPQDITVSTEPGTNTAIMYGWSVGGL